LAQRVRARQRACTTVARCPGNVVRCVDSVRHRLALLIVSTSSLRRRAFAASSRGSNRTHMGLNFVPFAAPAERASSPAPSPPAACHNARDISDFERRVDRAVVQAGWRSEWPRGPAGTTVARSRMLTRILRAPARRRRSTRARRAERARRPRRDARPHWTAPRRSSRAPEAVVLVVQIDVHRDAHHVICAAKERRAPPTEDRAPVDACSGDAFPRCMMQAQTGRLPRTR